MTEPTRDEKIAALRVEIMILEARVTTGPRHLAALRAILRDLEAGGWRPISEARLLEECSEAAHNEWLAEKRRRGVTSWPNERGFEQMVLYTDCPEDVKEFDRIVVGAIMRILRDKFAPPAIETGWRPISDNPPKANIVDLYAVHADGHGTRIPAGRWYGEWWSSIGPIRPPWRVTHYSLILAPPATSDGGGQ